MDQGLTSYESDVYSFGMIVYEVLTREVPWSDASSVKEIFRRVVIKRQRPVIPTEAPIDLADIARCCWASEPGIRPRLSSVLKSMNSQDWKEE